MTYNFSLFWRMSVRSIFQSANTHGALTRKRVIFLLLFYTFWPPMVLFTWACFLLDDLFFPAYRSQPVDKPLFILGNFRSGSTFLHRLLARDAATFTGLRTWDIFLMPSITQRRLFHALGRIDTWLGGPVIGLLRRFDARYFGAVRIHKIGLFEPEEDEMILMYAWSSFFIGFLFPFLDEIPPYQFFDTQIPKADRLRIMNFYRACLQRHLYATGGGRHFIAKNPVFSAKIETLLELFPDARIVYLVRNPLDMLPSTISWLSYAWHVSSDPKEKYPYRDDVLALTQYWYEHPLDVLDLNPSPLHMILSFEDLIRRPDAIIRELYTQFDYPPSRDLELILRDAVVETRTHESTHVYNYEEMDFSREQIVREFAGVFERFGFDQRGEVPVEQSKGKNVEYRPPPH
jgi:omega-hydroxy-beta-dihydromenaquinone-9 sulfotransferase